MNNNLFDEFQFFPPNSLFKYRDFENEFYKNLLINNELYFSSPSRFYDPFDCKIPPKIMIYQKDKLLKYFNYLAKKEFSELNEKEIKKIAKEEYNKNINIITNPELAAKRNEEVMNKRIGVCTLSEDNSNLLMWSHYSYKHTGFCIEYDGEELLQTLMNYSTIGEDFLIMRVKYVNKYPSIKPFQPGEFSLNEFLKLIAYKSRDWSYEKEWRITYTDNTDTKIELNNRVIKSICFGLNCDKEKINEVKEYTKDKNIKYYKAIKNKDSFSIKFKRI